MTFTKGKVVGCIIVFAGAVLTGSLGGDMWSFSGGVLATIIAVAFEDTLS